MLMIHRERQGKGEIIRFAMLHDIEGIFNTKDKDLSITFNSSHRSNEIWKFETKAERAEFMNRILETHEILRYKHKKEYEFIKIKDKAMQQLRAAETKKEKKDA